MDARSAETAARAPAAVWAAVWVSGGPPPVPPVVRRLAVATLIANVLIVLSGGAVRLTASGLGCPTWPRCTEESLVNTPEYGIHGYVEFGNRLFTVGLAAVALATVVAAVRMPQRRTDVVRLSVIVLLGIPLQAVIGGLTVLTGLDPWVVMLHFHASILLIVLSTILVWRTRQPPGPTRLVVPPAVAGLAVATLTVLAGVLYVGTVVTGSGPHAGDATARRTGLDPAAVSQLHADGVFLLVGMTVGLWVALRAAGAPPDARRAAGVLLAAEIGQGVIGFWQHSTALPPLLVNLHMLGAALLVVAAVHLLLSMRRPAPTAEPAGHPARSGAGDLQTGHPTPLEGAAP